MQERTQGGVALLSLRSVFAQASRLTGVSDASPVVTISLYRLLLAILQRSQALRRTRPGAAGAGGARPSVSTSVAQLRALLARGAWDAETQEAIDAYLTRWRARFDLFDADHPFYQTAGLRESERTGAATVLAHQRASNRNQSLLFDHTTRDRAWLTPAAAARALLAQQNFAVGGLISYDSAREPLANKFTSMAPLLGLTVCLVRGQTLFETLLLNWLGEGADGDAEGAEGAEEDVGDADDDLPAWEREEPTEAATRTPTGLVDLLTWQSRRIRLIPGLISGSLSHPASGDAHGRETLIVERAILMKGYQMSPAFDRHLVEPMIPFHVRAAERATGRATERSGGEAADWTPQLAMPGRAIWRDVAALLQSQPGARQRPRTLDGLQRLLHASPTPGEQTTSGPLALEVYSMTPDQATIEDWRVDRLPLPLALVDDEWALERLVAAVAQAEAVARLLGSGMIPLGGQTRSGRPLVVMSPVALLADALLSRNPARPAERAERDRLIAHWDAAAPYWAALTAPFHQLLRRLATLSQRQAREWEAGEQGAGEQALQVWARQVERVARAAFDRVVAGAATGTGAYQASIMAQSRFDTCLDALLTSAPAERSAKDPAALPVEGDVGASGAGRGGRATTTKTTKATKTAKGGAS